MKEILTALILLKNNSIKRNKTTIVSLSKTVLILTELLYKEGIILSYFVRNNKINITLRYSYNKDMFENLKIYCSKNKEYFLDYKKICDLSTRKKIYVFTTSQGLKTHFECKKYHLGGRLCFIC